jgi:ADP-ribose pyrophosphatase
MDDMTLPKFVAATAPFFEHGDWVQVYIDPDERGSGPGFIRIEERHGAPGVAVLPIADGKIGLVKVFRRTLRKTVLEIPRGFGGEGSGPRSDAVRELREETGISVNEEDLIDLGAVNPNSGILSSEVRLFAAVLPTAVKTEVQDTDEVEGFMWVDTHEVLDAVVNGAIADGFTHSALLHASLKGLVP